MFKCDVINDGHILIKADEPIRIEITKKDNGFLLFTYKGIEIDIEQEPLYCYETGENNYGKN